MDEIKCRICNALFEDSMDSLVVCNHLEGPVHLGCCSDLCSMHGGPCEHSQGVYNKQTTGESQKEEIQESG